MVGSGCFVCNHFAPFPRKSATIKIEINRKVFICLNKIVDIKGTKHKEAMVLWTCGLSVWFVGNGWE